MAIHVKDTKAPAFMPVKRISLNDLTEADVDKVLTGKEPIILEGMSDEWSENYRNMTFEELMVFESKPQSVHINGEQRFGISPEEILERLNAGENCRVFGAPLSPELSSNCSIPPKLFSRLKLFRHDNPRPVYFFGGGGAVTLLHHDFEMNANWHMVLHGERRIYLWTYNQSPNLFKLPIIGLSLIPFAKGFLDYRFARGYACDLSKGELLYMPPMCWHEVEYSQCSIALTYAFYTSRFVKFIGSYVGHFWLGFMSFSQAVQSRKLAGLVALPLMLPLALFTGLYVPLVFLAHKFLRRATFLVIAPIRVAEILLFLLYRPLMNAFRTKMRVGY